MKRVEGFAARVVSLFALGLLASACAATSSPRYAASSSYDAPASYGSLSAKDPLAPYGAPPAQYGSPSPYGVPLSDAPRRPMPAAQGWLGIGNIQQRNVDLDSNLGSVEDVDDATAPVIGGVFMQPLGGDRLAYGIEGGLSFSWSGDVDAVIVSNGGLIVAGSTDMFLGDLFGGPFVSFDLTPKARIYASAGIGLEWASYDLGFDTALGHQHVNGDAFGGEWYARTGIEFRISPSSWIGIGLRYIDSSLDPGSGISNVDVHQEQLLFTVTNGF